MARKSARELREARQARAGFVKIAAVTLAFTGMLIGAAMVDAAQGVSVTQSLQAWGL